MSEALQKLQGLSVFSQQLERVNKNDAVSHALFLHGDADGYIIFNQKYNESMKQKALEIGIMTESELEQLFAGYEGQKDVFMSLNSFYIPNRRQENTRELRSLYIDLDCYRQGLTISEALEIADRQIFRNDLLPLPNYYTETGKGLNFVWVLDDLPFKVKGVYKLWRHALLHFFSIFDSLSLGADSQCLEPSRIFRLAGTINSKNDRTVRVHYLHEHKFNLGKELRGTYFPNITYEPTKQEKKKRTGKVKYVFNELSLNYARMKDIEKLVSIRAGNMTGTREFICFIYRYHACLYYDDPERALEVTFRLNQTFTFPLSEAEIEKATYSAELGYYARVSENEANKWRELKNREGKVYPVPGYNYKNERLIELLEITEGEQEHLSTLISKNEKNRRERLKKREERNSVSREEHLQRLSDNRENKLNALRELMEQYPEAKNKELMELLNVSKAQFYRLKKEL